MVQLLLPVGQMVGQLQGLRAKLMRQGSRTARLRRGRDRRCRDRARRCQAPGGQRRCDRIGRRRQSHIGDLCRQGPGPKSLARRRRGRRLRKRRLRKCRPRGMSRVDPTLKTCVRRREGTQRWPGLKVGSAHSVHPRRSRAWQSGVIAGASGKISPASKIGCPALEVQCNSSTFGVLTNSERSYIAHASRFNKPARLPGILAGPWRWPWRWPLGTGESISVVFSIVVRTLRVRKTAHGVCRLLSLRLLLIRRS
jgi:hypothetical protein